MRFQLTIPATLALSLLAFACETSNAPSAGGPGGPDGGAPTPIVGGPVDPRCASIPASIPPEQSAPCKDAGLRCEWKDNVLGTAVAICDGMFWRVGQRDRDCPSTPPAGRCGSYDGQCGYVETGAYPKASGTGSDTCISACYCRDGVWGCDSSCKCPGKPTDDPAGVLAILYFKGACLHTDMRCDYAYRIGQSTGFVGQPCLTSYTCSAEGRWQGADTCTCPAFTPSDRDWVSECRSDGLQCQFPGSADTDPPRTCTCRGDSWMCPQPF
jgi:hypothetical protein